MNLVLLAENRVITSIFSFKISPLSPICLPINLWAGEVLAMLRRIFRSDASRILLSPIWF